MNPYFEGNSISNTVLDDRLISHTLENWIFGEDYDGDILKESNLRSLIAYCKTLGEINLVTGDGSIDCHDQPENQEEFVSKLHTAEFIASLAILANNGSMLIKMFTFYETSSISMLYILSCCFRELHIFKPATSKEGNSEVYVIAIGYKKSLISDEIVEKMIANFKDGSKSLLPLDLIPKEFLQQVVEAARLFMNLQVAVIEGNIRTFKRFDKTEHDRIKAMKIQLVEEYARLYKTAPIKEEQKILHGLRVNNDINLNVRVHSGSHSERLVFYHLAVDDQIQVFFDRLKQFYDSILENSPRASNSLKLCQPDINPAELFKFIRGKKIEKVVSSKFLLVSLVKYLNELRTFLASIGDQHEPYNDRRKFKEDKSRLLVDMEYFRRVPMYDVYEKDVIMRFLSYISRPDTDLFILEGLPLFTQFTVGVMLYLSVFVFEEVLLKRSACAICFMHFRPNGKQNLQTLIASLNEHHSPSKALLGICDTKLLFSYSPEFYKSVIDYNNHLCLKFCSFYLNISNNL